MKLSTTFLIFISTFLQISAESEDFKEINEHFVKLNENLRSAFSAYNDLIAAKQNRHLDILEKSPSLVHLAPEYKAAINFKLDFPFYDEIKSILDIKIPKIFSENRPPHLINKCFITDDIHDEAEEEIQRIQRKHQKELEKHQDEVEKVTKKVTTEEANKERDLLRTLNANFSAAWRAFCSPLNGPASDLINNKLKSYNCPLTFSASNPALEDHDKLLKTLKDAQETYGYSFSIDKIKQDIKNSNDPKIIEDAFSCIKESLRRVKMESTRKNETAKGDKNSCAKLEYELAVEDVKSWMISQEIARAKDRRVNCLQEGLKKYEKEVEGATSDKEILKKIVEGFKQLEEENKKFFKVFEEVTEKLPEVNQKMKKFYDENCQCKKK